jgi:hypothetical protein
MKWWAGDESYIININDEMILSDILDAGIHPRHVPGLGHDTLQFQAKSVTFVFTSGNRLTTFNGYGRIYVGENHHILNIVFYEKHDTGIDEAYQRMAEMMPALNGGGISDKELRDNIERVRNAENHWVAKSFGVGAKEVDKFWRANVTASQSFNPKKPFRFIFTVSRIYQNRERDRPKRNTMGVLLVPPKGYEHISFKYITSPTDPNATPIPYLSPLEKARQLADNVRRSEESAKNLSTLPDGESNKSNCVIENSKNSTGIIVAYIVAVAVVLGFGVAYFVFMRKRT